MPLPRPHTFPLVPYPGSPPEADPTGTGWEPYALRTPAGRLPPFALARPTGLGGAAWVNCARIEHADTGALLATLVPTGGAPGPLGLLLDKYAEAGDGVEYFAYTGAVVPGLAALLPCGVRARLVLDNEYQSPRFVADAATEAAGLLLEWSHPTPLAGAPYGAGLAQRLYVPGGALVFAEPRTERTVSKDPDSGAEQVDLDARWPRRTLATAPLPAYLAEALALLPQHETLQAGGQPWRAVEVKTAPYGTDGARFTVALTVESLLPSLRRTCGPPAPVPAAYDPVADAPRPWRCGDSTDTTPDFQPTGAFTCALDADGFNTGFSSVTEADANPYSPTAGTSRARPPAADAGHCPLPFASVAITESVERDDCAPGLRPGRVDYTLPAGHARSASSQQAADALARTDFDAAKQAYANANAVCYDRQVSVAVARQANGAWLATFTRTDTRGEVLLSFEVDREDGTGEQVHYAGAITLPAGTASATRVVGQLTTTYATATITATDPADYTIG